MFALRRQRPFPLNVFFLQPGLVPRYALAVGLFLLAFLICRITEREMAYASRYLPYVVAVVLTAWLSGTGPALLTMTLGAAAVAGPLWQQGVPINSAALAMYLMASLFCVLTASLLDRARAEALIALKAAEQRGLELEEALRAYRTAEEKLIENRFWLSMAESAAKVGRWSHDFTTGETVGSDTLNELLGEQRDSSNSYGDLHARVHPEDIARVRSAIEVAKVNGEEYEVEFRIIRKDGEERWVNERGKLFLDPIQSTKYLSGVMTDITRRKQVESNARELRATLASFQAGEAHRVEQELERVRGELVRQTRFAAIGQLSASIAHDLRNPLGVIRNAVYLLRRRLTKIGEKPDLLNMIDEEVLAADAIITNMMEMTRGREPARDRVDLGAMLREITTRMDSSGRITWRIDMQHEPFWLWCDPSQFRQVLQNLLRNSVEAMKGQGTVIVEASEQGEWRRIRIHDAGPGISNDVIPHLFEPLMTTKKGGTGLGLMICKQIIERHGGSIALIPRLESDREPGATFEIRLPNHAEADAEVE